MAMIDYGAVVKINGKIVNENQFFMDMQQAVGWIDHPKKRYPDCDCLDDKGYSECFECPRRKTEHQSHPELGEWDATIGDCRGNEIPIQDKLDRNFFAYVGDEDFTIAFYKTSAVITNKNKTLYARLWYGFYSKDLGDTDVTAICRKMVRRFDIKIGDETIHLKIKRIGEGESKFYMRFIYKHNIYEIIYGYGIDPNKEVWNEVKHIYSTKKAIRIVDRFWQYGRHVI